MRRRGPARRGAALIVDTLWPLVQQGTQGIPRGGYLLRRGRGRSGSNRHGRSHERRAAACRRRPRYGPDNTEASASSRQATPVPRASGAPARRRNGCAESFASGKGAPKIMPSPMTKAVPVSRRTLTRACTDGEDGVAARSPASRERVLHCRAAKPLGVRAPTERATARMRSRSRKGPCRPEEPTAPCESPRRGPAPVTPAPRSTPLPPASVPARGSGRQP